MSGAVKISRPMRLCFGTFTTVLYICSVGTTQAEIVNAVVRCVDHEGWYSIDKSAANHLMACEREFVLDNRRNFSAHSLEDVAEYIGSEVLPYVPEDNWGKVLLTLLAIIREDQTIESEHERIFERCFHASKEELLQRDGFNIRTFLAQVSQYVSCREIRNTTDKARKGSDTANRGNADFKKFIMDRIEKAAEDHAGELAWDESDETVTLLHTKLFLAFNDAMLDNKVEEFVERVDPTNYMSSVWLDRCADFRSQVTQAIEKDDLLRGIKGTSLTLQNVNQFLKTLDEYLDYVGTHMITYLDDSSQHKDSDSLFIPLHRDEDVEWVFAYAKGVEQYRRQLISIYQEMYRHMPFYRG